MSNYNGWRNRETWLVALWYSPETPADVDYLEETLNEELEAMPNGCLRDMCYLDAVDWKELRESVDEANEAMREESEQC